MSSRKKVLKVIIFSSHENDARIRTLDDLQVQKETHLAQEKLVKRCLVSDIPSFVGNCSADLTILGG